MAEKTMAELLWEAAAALDKQRDAGSETATNMPAPDRTGEGFRPVHRKAETGETVKAHSHPTVNTDTDRFFRSRRCFVCQWVRRL